MNDDTRINYVQSTNAMPLDFTITCHDISADDAREKMNSRPGVEVQTRDNDWRVSYGFGPEIYLDLMCLEEVNTEPGWSNHLEQMREFVRANEPDQQKRNEAIDLIGTQSFALSVLAEPDLKAADPRLEAIKEWASKFNAIITTPDGIFDCDMKPIIVRNKKPWWNIW